MIKVVNKGSYEGTDEVYVGRPTPLGNPYTHEESSVASFKVDTREEAVEMYKVWIAEQLKDQNSEAYAEFESLVEFYCDFGELTMSCWCDPLPCHAHILADMIEREANVRKK